MKCGCLIWLARLHFIVFAVPDEKHGRDYVTENMKHIRQVSSQTRKSRSKEVLEPLRAKFIPGITRNPKYDHVESRISGLIQVSGVFLIWLLPYLSFAISFLGNTENWTRLWNSAEQFKLLYLTHYQVPWDKWK